MKSKVTVDLSEGELRFDGRSVFLTRRLAKLASILAAAMPATVPHETATAKMWGDKEIDVDGNLKVAACQLRKEIRRVGLTVVPNWGIGYRMAETSKTARTSTLEESRAQA